MRSMTRFIAATVLALTPAATANAQDSIFDFFKNFGNLEDAPQDAPPADDPTTSYFGNKQADLPNYRGNVDHLAGAWTITTERNSDTCTLDGHAQIRSLPAGGYTCDLVMRDYCYDLWDGIVRQSCEISVDGADIYIDAAVLEALNGATLSGYSPDDFILRMQDDGSLSGHHESYGSYPAIWRRTVDGIS